MSLRGPRKQTRARVHMDDVELGEGIILRPTQQAFAASTCRHKAYIGPFGSGKSLVLCLVCLLLAAAVPGNVGVIGRYTRADFNRTTRLRLEQLLVPGLVQRELPDGAGWEIRTSDPEQPSTLWTAHYDETGPYASMDLGFFAIDEINGDDLTPSVPEEVYKMLVARLGRATHVKRPYGMVAGNPCGHNWVWNYFHPDSPNRKPEHEMFCPKPYENAQNLQPGYYERLEETMGPEWVARFILGSHDVFEGQVYPELTDQYLVDPFPIPEHWPAIICLDYGLRSPTAVGFLRISEDGVVYAVDEHYVAGKGVPYHAAEIKKRLPVLEKARYIRWPADPSIFAKTMQRQGQTYSVFDEYAECGLDQWEAGENDVRAGRERIKKFLAVKKLYFFRGRVPNLWREMTQLHWYKARRPSEATPKEEEADVDNHSPDYLRYGLMTRPDPARPIPQEAPPKTIGEQRTTRAHRLLKAAKRAYKQRQDHPEDQEYV